MYSFFYFLNKFSNLSPIHCALLNEPFLWCPPLIDAPIRADVPNSGGVDLKQGILANECAAQGGCCAQEAGVRDFLHGLTNGQDQGGICERDNDVRVEGIWKLEILLKFK